MSRPLVSTNSICQGESVEIMWEPLLNRRNIEIQFAYRTFMWVSESKEQAAVHCVIIGFTSKRINAEKFLYEGNIPKQVSHINGYLVDAPDIFVRSRGKQLTAGLSAITKGSQPTDGGHLLLSDTEYKDLIAKYPVTKEYLKRFVGAEEFIHGKLRWCLWLQGVSPKKYASVPPVMERLKKVAETRAKSPTKSVQKDASIPMLFTQIRQPESDYIIVPRHSSERRRYIPMGFIDASVICGDANYLIPNATIYQFGILTSNIHMAWMRTVCGRLKSDYRYSPAVYNNFPWPNPTNAQKAKIEKTAQTILDARALYPDCSLAELYDELAMPPELRKAHQDNDRAVMDAYGFVKGHPARTSESQCVAELMKLYQSLSEPS